MKVLQVTGSYPPDVCGVGDYTSCLIASLQGEGVDASVFRSGSWGLGAIPEVVDRINCLQCDIVHLQYPTLGYGHRLGPQLLAMMKPMVVTIHEASQAHLLRRLSLFGFSVRSQRIVFTTDEERRYATRWCPWIEDRSFVIPIGSNIPMAPDRVQAKADAIGYFGLIRPAKGLEQVIELAHLLQEQKSDLRVRIVGKVPAGSGAYHEELRARSQGAAIEWHTDVDDGEVTRLIGSCRFAYLPFPDGASERRASLLAFLAAGACVITTRGSHTPATMDGCMRFSTGPAQALQLIRELRSDEGAMRSLEEAGLLLARRFSWPAIARRHIELYDQVLKGSG